jgi:hypothetical protein
MTRTAGLFCERWEKRVSGRVFEFLAVEIHEDWIEAHRYLNMETRCEQSKELQLLKAA